MRGKSTNLMKTEGTVLSAEDALEESSRKKKKKKKKIMDKEYNCK